MGFLIEGEVIGLESEREGCGLTEAEGEAFAGDGIDRAGGVPDEGYVACGDTMQCEAKSDGAAGSTAGLGRSKMTFEGREMAEGFGWARDFFV